MQGVYASSIAHRTTSTYECPHENVHILVKVRVQTNQATHVSDLPSSDDEGKFSQGMVGIGATLLELHAISMC